MKRLCTALTFTREQLSRPETEPDGPHYQFSATLQNVFRPFGKHAAYMLLVAGAAAMLSGCAAIPLKRLQPVVAPPNASCTSDEFRFLASEPTEFHYALPSGVPVNSIVRSSV